MGGSLSREKRGCFFAWYTAAVTGNGDIRPCCLLLDPAVKPLGNIHHGKSFAEHWNGPAFVKMRDEMREYAELDQKLREARKNEIRWIGTKKQRKRATDLFLQTHPRVKNVWDCCRDRSRPLRKLLKTWFGWNLTDAV